ncbi:MAG: Dam family site-specific DNA-(adenine-N6)-methyltransferase [Candidatus Obscuribacterales bacterium]|nr:Dam family site-specific DNA-(adenine-N6)-methyltransferase [Cyanobacteria bacterium SZAS LIN-5]
MDIQTEIISISPQDVEYERPEAPSAVQVVARPFLKWVGGKTQILPHIDANIPIQLRDSDISAYIEPFLGGGSVFFHIAQRYRVKRYLISDNNRDLIWAYETVKSHVEPVIEALANYQQEFWPLSTEERSKMYYDTRDAFNNSRNEDSDDIEFRVARTAQLIFLNKTCFNGLYRVNAAGAFNVAFGRYDKPPICDRENLLACSRVLSVAEIRLCDFGEVLHSVGSNAFIYLDPPYRPISLTANFTSYSPTNFDAIEQQRLAAHCLELDKRESKLMISNSDPKNINPDDRYFEETYPHFRITTLAANRMVNCKTDRRGKISELLITNY